MTAPREVTLVDSHCHIDMYHYVAEKREALTRWVQRLAKILGHDPNDVMKVERKGCQGKGPTRKLARRESARAGLSEAALPARIERHGHAQDSVDPREVGHYARQHGRSLAPERGGKRQVGEPSPRLVLVNQDPHR